MTCITYDINYDYVYGCFTAPSLTGCLRVGFTAYFEVLQDLAFTTHLQHIYSL